MSDALTATLPQPPATAPAPVRTGVGAAAREVGWHLLAAVASTVVMVAGLQLVTVVPADSPLTTGQRGLDATVLGYRVVCADLYAPFSYEGDALLILPFVKATLERGSHWRNERLGAPGIQELHDFPVVDHLHLAIIWLLGVVFPDTVVVFNLYHLLTYPLTTVAAMAVLRHFRLSVPAAACGGMLYAFLPYHYLRGMHHYFLSAYWMVPVTLMVALWVCRGRLPFFRQNADGRYRFAPFTRDTVVAVVVAAATAAAGAYYAFFACALLAAAAAYGWVATGTWRGGLSGGLVTAAVAAFGLANHAPAVAYQKAYGRNSEPTSRLSEEAEVYGLKVIHMVLPVSGHHSHTLATVRADYDSPDRPLQNENRESTLGVFGAAALVGLLAMAVLPVRRVWPLGPLSGLTAFAVLLGTIGGVGAVFNHLVSPQVRCYNRVSVYVAFLCLFAAVWVLDRAARRWPAWARWALFVGVAAAGVWDLTDFRWFRPMAATDRVKPAAQYQADAAFYGDLERAMPGGTVFCLPYVAYPEVLQVENVGGYEHVRGYLHTNTLKWSFGVVRGRETDQWIRETSALPPAAMLKRLAAWNFDGLLIDRRGYAEDDIAVLFAGVEAELGPDAPRIERDNREAVVFDLRPYRERLAREMGPALAAIRTKDEEAVRVLWLHGFFAFSPAGQEAKHRGCQRTGLTVWVNPTNKPKTVKVEVVLAADGYGKADDGTPQFGELRIEGGSLWSEKQRVSSDRMLLERTLTVPPGRTSVWFRCKPPADFFTDDPHRLVFFAAQFKLTELD